MNKRWIALALFVCALFVGAAGAATSARQFSKPIGTYERAVAAGVQVWRNTGTKCEFRSGRTMVYCETYTNKWGTARTTIRRVSATKLRFTIRVAGASHTWVAKGS